MIWQSTTIQLRSGRQLHSRLETPARATMPTRNRRAAPACSARCRGHIAESLRQPRQRLPSVDFCQPRGVQRHFEQSHGNLVAGHAESNPDDRGARRLRPGLVRQWVCRQRIAGRGSECQPAGAGDRRGAALNQTIPQVTQTQTVAPSLEAQISEFNAINAASPNPTLAGLTNLFGSVAGFGAGGGFGNLFGGGDNILSGGTGNVDNALSASTQAYTDSLFANAGAGGGNIPPGDQ